MTALLKRARASGIDQDSLDEVQDAESPKDALVSLLVDAELGAGSIQAIPTPLDDGWLSFDEIATGLPDSVLQKGGGITVEANNERVVLEDAPVDALFTIRTTEEEEIESPSDLERLQEELSEAGPQIARLPRTQRQAAEAAQELVQTKLDTAKQLFDDQSRGTLTGQAFTAKLKSL